MVLKWRENRINKHSLLARTFFEARDPKLITTWQDFNVQTTYEKIEYPKFPRGESPKIKPVDHFKARCSTFTPILIRDQSVYDFWYGPGTIRQFATLNPANEHSQFENLLPWDSYVYNWVPDPDSMIDDRIDDIYTPPDFVVFAAEFRELPDLIFEGWRSLGFLNLPRWLQWRSILNDARSLNAWRDAVSNGVLTTNLGILPTYREITGLWNHANRGARDWDRVIRLLQEPTGFTVTDSVSASVERYHGEHAMDYIIDGVHKRVVGFTCHANTGLEDGGIGSLITTMNALGVHFDLETLWNLTPLSFVADYVYPVGDALRQSRLYHNPTISDGWISDRWSGRFEGHCYYSNLGYGPVTGPGSHAGILSHYKRYQHIWERPNGIALSPRERPTFPAAGESMNTLSLFLNTMRIGRRRRQGYLRLD